MGPGHKPKMTTCPSIQTVQKIISGAYIKCKLVCFTRTLSIKKIQKLWQQENKMYLGFHSKHALHLNFYIKTINLQQKVRQNHQKPFICLTTIFHFNIYHKMYNYLNMPKTF